jgi:hypothetical protein
MNDAGFETEIYDYIGLAYFYLGKIEKGNFEKLFLFIKPSTIIQDLY